ncbi:hypothetical protein ACFODZ_07495 [Marinicella sediminis]|uniref:Uncharacterized protein n=2 Tax=Marinicella sediminis TaxID=1792834 RepID=A0ABV7JBP5_9GAMM
MSAQQWVAKVNQLIDSQDWTGLESMNQQVCQRLVDRKDMNSLVDFYEQAFELVAGAVKVDHLSTDDLKVLGSDLQFVLTNALSQSAVDPDIKAIYLEYHYDGGDSTELNLFLSEKHPDEDTECWGSYFGDNGFIEGPNVHHLFHFDPDGELSDLEVTIATECVRAHLITVLMSVIDGLKPDVPVGFAAHDGFVVMLN